MNFDQRQFGSAWRGWLDHRCQELSTAKMEPSAAEANRRSYADALWSASSAARRASKISASAAA